MKTRFKTVSSSHISISELMLPSHTNFSGKIHGGYILSLLDQIAFACASKFSENYCVTASVDTVNFLKPIEVGELVTMKASVNYVGHSSMIVGIRVEAENIRTGVITEDVIAKAVGAFEEAEEKAMSAKEIEQNDARFAEVNAKRAAAQKKSRENRALINRHRTAYSASPSGSVQTAWRWSGSTTQASIRNGRSAMVCRTASRNAPT